MLILIIVAFSVIVITCDFQCVSTSYINKYEKDVEYYLGYEIHWESFVNPVIKDVYLLDEHNQVANNLNYDNIDVDFVIYENINNL
ncbi:hypothetical protein [Sporosalibacterium faouarense]|uniref:hypothetical protein n=1 Tax=Sporosalibacterium faouarense TaxID=516123 RepID=UPI00141C4280|nr:hypothetical protein [Sporosalibacterium faouarense]MTI47650.1 hypothetical protein [Bacillota bacterium]